FEDKKMNPKEVLEDVFFILVPTENWDGRDNGTRNGGYGTDLNRDGLFQAQIESQNMTKMIAHFNPVNFFELHGFYAQYQIEPCTPPHNANFEYDLFAENNMRVGEAFGNASVANSKVYQTYKMPMRDYLTNDVTSSGAPSPGAGKQWRRLMDDAASAYSVGYAMLHGTLGYTIEIPQAYEATTETLQYGLIGNAVYTAETKDKQFKNLLRFWERGVKNIDAADGSSNDKLSIWFEDRFAKPDVKTFRPKFEENDSYFPEYYVIPNEKASQRNLAESADIQRWLLANDVKLKKLNSEVKCQDKNGKDVTLAAGSIVVDMKQAKRNVANEALHDGVLAPEWGSSFYSEPITNFAELRGFEMYTITTAGILNGKTSNITAVQRATNDLVTKKYAIIKNSSIDAVRAVNYLLNQTTPDDVGFITSGSHEGDFVVTKAVYDKLAANSKDTYTLTVLGTNTAYPAKKLQPVKILPTIPAFADYNGTSPNFYSSLGANRQANNGNRTQYNYFLQSVRDDMGFKLAADLASANIIAGSGDTTLTATNQAAILSGKPYVGWGPGGITGINAMFNTGAQIEGVDRLGIGTITQVAGDGSADALVKVDYPDKSLATAAKVNQNDDSTYSYGTSYISGGTAIGTPNVKTLVKTGKDPSAIIAGSLDKSRYAAETGFFDKPLGIQYKDATRYITWYTTELTRKTHSRDDYLYASSAIFEGTMTNTDFAYGDAWKITFNANSATGVMGDQSITKTDTENLDRITFTNTGYTFKGWSDSADGQVVYADKAAVTPSADMTLFAIWGKNCTVTFWPNTGLGTKYTQFLESGTGKLLPNAFKKTSYAIASWNTRANGTGTSYANGATVALFDNTVLYAQWKPITVTSIKLSKASATVARGKSLALKATILPADALDKAVIWKSSNTKYATVSAAGKVTINKKAKKGATVTITCTAKDGSKKAGTCKIKIK
ncbi:MAG: InlB B-repeat-containing protein, partial [Anaerovoracaceae bacterium]